MIKELTTIPKPRNNNAKIAFLITFLISAVSFVTYFFMERFRGFVGLFALMMLVTAILIYTKYISPVFCYDITFDSENTPVFVVRKRVGKRESTLCRIDIADIVSVNYETKSERRAHKTPRGMLKYVYAPTMFPPDTYRITVKGRYEKAEIIVEITEEYAKMLRAYTEEAKELRLLEDGE